MCQSSSRPLPEQDRFESAVLREIIYLLPARPTFDELRLSVGDKDDHGVSTEDAIWGLRRAGLVRYSGDVLEPTLPALCAFKLLTAD